MLNAHGEPKVFLCVPQVAIVGHICCYEGQKLDEECITKVKSNEDVCKEPHEDHLASHLVNVKRGSLSYGDR
jgi:hypothetical protein